MAILPNLNSLKVGLHIVYTDEPFVIMSANFVRMQQRKPVMQTKIKSLVSGKVLGINFKPGDRIEEAILERAKVNYLYRDETTAYFMDNESYEQFELSLMDVKDKIEYLKDGDSVDILKFQEKPVSLDIPKKVTLKVVSAPPGVKGDTASGNVTKEVELENGIKARTPLFIKDGDSIIVNTDTGEYVERA